jgi:hypothetical protein
VRLLIPTLALAAVVSTGCTGPVVRDGIWELSFVDVKRRMIGASGVPDQEIPPPKKLVRLQVISSAGDVQTAIVTHLATARDPNEAPTGEEDEETPKQTSLKPMRLRIVYKGMDDPDGVATVRIEHEDSSWIWQMWGTVADPAAMGGYFSARGRYKSNLALEGHWNCRLMQEE